MCESCSPHESPSNYPLQLVSTSNYPTGIRGNWYQKVQCWQGNSLCSQGNQWSDCIGMYRCCRDILSSGKGFQRLLCDTLTAQWSLGFLPMELVFHQWKYWAGGAMTEHGMELPMWRGDNHVYASLECPATTSACCGGGQALEGKREKCMRDQSGMGVCQRGGYTRLQLSMRQHSCAPLDMCQRFK